jgi:hypothetical protein
MNPTDYRRAVAVEMQLPDDLAARVARVVADVDATANVNLSFGADQTPVFGPSYMLLDESGCGAGIGFLTAACEEEIACLADQIQEVVIETRWHNSINPVAWPECPVHRTHPLQATADSGEATWTCLKDATISFAIGSLG